MLQTILLRFRDFRTDIDTITAHQKHLENHSTVWWAWWKKDTEPERDAELQEVQRLLESGPLEIGIFDRSTARFFRARLHRCAYTAGEKIPCPEQGGTPEYVRQARMAAWFQLSTIEVIGRAEFIAAFGGVPPSDVSLFPIGFLGSSHPTVAAISDTQSWPKLRGNVILHLSDLHFGADFGFPRTSTPGGKCLRDIIRDDLKKANVSPDDVALLIISGDLTTKADANRFFEEVKEFLEHLCSDLRLDRRHVLVVPGNHDFRLVEWNPHDYSHENAFIGFLASFYGTTVEDLPEVFQCRLANGRAVELLLMNSVRVRHERDRYYGYVGWDRYEGILAEHPYEKDVLRIAILHHHLLSTTREEAPDADWHYANISVTLDAGSVIEGLQMHRFHLVLHGHQHVPGLSRIARGRRHDNDPAKLDGLERTMYLLGAGSAGSTSTRLSQEFPHNSYNILRVASSELDIEARQYTTSSASTRAWRCTIPSS